VQLVVKKKVLGTKYDLIVEEDGTHHYATIGEQLPKDALVVPSRRYHEIRKLYGLKWRSFPPERFKRPYEVLLQDRRLDLPWEKLIPQTLFKKALAVYVQGLWSDLCSLKPRYYESVFEKHSPLFYSLERAAIDVGLFNRFMRKAEGSATGAILKSFNPVKPVRGVWYADPVEYDRISSLTGRLKIRKGPGILHLKREYRPCIVSRYGDDGAIYYLDYKSLEPRLLLSICDPEAEIPKDPYLYAARTMGVEDDIDREHIKTAIISMIYGAGDSELVRQLKPYISYPEDFVKSVKERFGVEELKERLRTEYEAHGGRMIYNRYGRPIFSEGTAPYVLVNYFIQSTAVDIALFGFSRIVDKILKSGAIDLIKPLFVLHDALILDVHKDVAHILPKLAELGSSDIPEFEGTKFWIEVERLPNTLDNT